MALSNWSGKLAGLNALFTRFVIKRIELGLEILFLILKGANLNLDGLALVTLVELDATRVGRRLSRFEILQVGDLLIHINNSLEEFFDLVPNRGGVLRVCCLGSGRLGL